MTAKWGSCVILVTCLALSLGCRTSQPVLKPEKTAERLVEPPSGGRYDTPGYPRQAFDKVDDPAQRAMDAAKTPGVVPTRGSMLPGTGSGMGGMSGR